MEAPSFRRLLSSLIIASPDLMIDEIDLCVLSPILIHTTFWWLSGTGIGVYQSYDVVYKYLTRGSLVPVLTKKFRSRGLG